MPFVNFLDLSLNLIAFLLILKPITLVITHLWPYFSPYLGFLHPLFLFTI